LSRKEQSAILFFLWAKRLYANQTHSEMHQVYGDKCFTMRTVKRIVSGQKFALNAELQSAIRQCVEHSEAC